MELNINSPAYYTQQFGVNDSVYKYCHKCYMFFKDKEYSNLLNTIGITPVVAPKEILLTGKWKETVNMICGNTAACIFIHIDYDEYCSGDDCDKVNLIKIAILSAIKRVKSKGMFDYEKFREDLKQVE